MTRRASLLTLGLLVVALGGCVAVGGTRTSTAVAPTTGQQLIDLKRALDCGAISQTEYDRKRNEVLNCKGC